MDFHHTLLAVGSREKVVTEPFKIWDMAAFSVIFQFDAYVGCVNDYMKIFQFVVSIALDGKIKAWLYDNVGSRDHCEFATLQDNGAQRYYIVLMEADYFLGGTSKDGDFPSRVDEIEGALKMTYLGFRKKSAGIDQFDTNRNHSLADDQVKFWDMDKTNLLTSVD